MGRFYYMIQHIVKNLRQGKSSVPPGYSSWLDYWEKKTGIKTGFCHRSGCFQTATDGAHVQIVNGGNEWYIVPLCHSCNMDRGASFAVNGPLVPVNPDYPIKK